MVSEVDQLLNDWGGVTEEYKFYDGTITLRYDPVDHVYLLVTDGQLIKQDGVTTICHIIDKSNALIPWGCKKMAQKILLNAPKAVENDFSFIPQLTWDEFETLVNDGKSAHKEALEDAADVGKQAHAWIENRIKFILGIGTYQNLPDNPRVANCCQASLNWMAAHKVKWVSTERKIYSREYGYAGTMDGLAYVSSCDDPTCCKTQFTDRLSVIDWKSSNYLYIEYLFQTAAYEQAVEEEDGVQIEDRWVIRLGKDDGEFDPWHLEGPQLSEKHFQAFLYCLLLSRAVVEVESQVKSVKEQAKAAAKAKAKAAKEAQLKIKCKGADKYKGIKPPKCNGGNPCQSCLAKYQSQHP